MDDFERRFYGKKAEQAIAIQYGEFLKLHLDVLRACHSMLSEERETEPSIKNRYFNINFILAHNLYWAIHKLVTIGFAFESLPLLRALFEIHADFHYIMSLKEKEEERLDQAIAYYDKENVRNKAIYLAHLSGAMSDEKVKKFQEIIEEIKSRIKDRGKNQKELQKGWGKLIDRCRAITQESDGEADYTKDYDMIYRYSSDILHANPEGLSSKVRFEETGLVYKPGPQVDEHIRLVIVFSAKFFISICHMVDKVLFEEMKFNWGPLVSKLKELIIKYNEG